MGEYREQRMHTEPAVLDIGGEIGALILYTNGDRCGQEIEVSPLVGFGLMLAERRTVGGGRSGAGRNAVALARPDRTAAKPSRRSPRARSLAEVDA